MAVEVFANNFSTTLALGAAPADLSFTVNDSPPAALTAGQFRILVDAEYVLVTAVGGAGNKTWTVSRAQEGTAAASHQSGSAVTHLITAAFLGSVIPASSTPAKGPGVQWAINVRDGAYGAKGDGATDDTAAIQAALNAVPATGAVVYIPNGNYILSSSLTVAAGTCIRGDGFQTLLTMNGAFTGLNALFLIQNATRVIVEDLRIEGQKSTKPGSSVTRGILVEQSSHVRLRSLYINDASHAGILFNGGCTDGVASDNVITGGGNTVQGGAANGISVDINLVAGGASATTTIAIVDNYFENIYDSPVGVHNTSANVVVSGNMMNGNTIGHGIDIAGATGVSVTGNTLRNLSGADAIFIHTNLGNPATDVTVAGNTIIGNAGAATQIGINVQGTVANPCKRLAITGNTVSGLTGVGLYIGTQLSDSTIEGNVLSGGLGNAAIYNGTGLMFDTGGAGIANNSIVGNVISQNANYGIYFQAAAAGTGNKVTQNLLVGNVIAVNVTTAQKVATGWFGNGPQDTDIALTDSGHEATGAGSAALGANSPAVTNTAPYKWLKLISSDGSTVYVPAWK